MSRSNVFGNWAKETVMRAISILGLIRITRAAREVELRSPARECPECHEMVEVMVLPASVCATCWSRKVIGSWQVLPLSTAEVVAVAGMGRAAARRRG